MTTKLIVLACLLTTSAAHSNEIERPDDSFRIIGGSDAQPGEFPYVVAFGSGRGKLPNGFRGFCGGSIINNRWIMTAAHCVDGLDLKWSTYYVLAGTYDIRNYEKSVQGIPVVSFFMHENYTWDASINDIALLKLKRSLEFNKNVAPINLPKRDMEPTGPVILSGWGRVEDDAGSDSDILQKANLEIVDRKTCNQAFIKLYNERNITLDEDMVRNEEICSGPLNSVMGGCNGDSGSALIRKDEKGNAEVVGIAAWVTKPCGTIGAPTVYTKVSLFIDWIENIMANN